MVLLEVHSNLKFPPCALTVPGLGGHHNTYINSLPKEIKLITNGLLKLEQIFKKKLKSPFICFLIIAQHFQIN